MSYDVAIVKVTIDVKQIPERHATWSSILFFAQQNISGRKKRENSLSTVSGLRIMPEIHTAHRFADR